MLREQRRTKDAEILPQVSMELPGASTGVHFESDCARVDPLLSTFVIMCLERRSGPGRPSCYCGCSLLLTTLHPGKENKFISAHFANELIAEAAPLQLPS